MKKLLLLSIVLFLLNCSTAKKSLNSANELNGVWIPTKQELGGKELPTAAFESYKLTIADSIYTYGTAAIDKGTLKYKQGKMDIYGKDGVNAGKHFTAIYKQENGKLTICYNLKGDTYPEDFKTSGKPLFFVSIFKKEFAK